MSKEFDEISESKKNLDGSILSDDLEIDSDISKSSEKDKKEFEREVKDYPILGEDDSIFDMRRKGFFNLVKSKVSDVFVLISPSNLFSKIKDASSKNRSKDAKDSDGMNSKKDDEFILEGFEGVYYNSTKKLSRKQLLNYASLVVGIIFFALTLFFAGKFVITSFSPSTSECPFECCIDTSFDDKLCPGFATCQNNICVLPDCPDHYECCLQDLYNEKLCPDDYLVCNLDFECVQKDCPHECCTTSDPFKPKDCLDDGNCINNQCFFEPCPYQCCVDDIGFDDKLCSETQVCVDNVCRSRLLERARNLVSIFVTSFRVLFG